MFKIQPSQTGVPTGGASTSVFASGPFRQKAPCVLRFTPSQWRAILESHDFLERPNTCFQHPRRFQGARVQIIPDESFR